MKQYPYQVTYKLKSFGNKRFNKKVEAACQAEAKQRREKDPELQAQYKAQRKATRAKAKQEREERLKATTPSEELYSFIPLQSPAEEKPPIKSLEEIEEEWIKKQVDDLFNSSPKPELYPSWDDMFSDEEKEELSRRF